MLLIYGICILLGVLSLILTGAGQIYAFLGVFMLIGLALLVLSRLSLDDATTDAAAATDGSGRS